MFNDSGRWSKGWVSTDRNYPHRLMHQQGGDNVMFDGLDYWLWSGEPMISNWCQDTSSDIYWLFWKHTWRFCSLRSKRFLERYFGTTMLLYIQWNMSIKIKCILRDICFISNQLVWLKIWDTFWRGKFISKDEL